MRVEDFDEVVWMVTNSCNLKRRISSRPVWMTRKKRRL